MTPQDQKSILTIALYAAFADGDKHDREREEIRRIAGTLAAQAHAPELGGLYQDVLLQRVTLDAAATALSSTGLRQLAYEMAVCVCDADGRQSEAELDKSILNYALLNGALPQIQQKAATLDMGQVMAMARGALSAVRRAGAAPSAWRVPSGAQSRPPP